MSESVRTIRIVIDSRQAVDGANRAERALRGIGGEADRAARMFNFLKTALIGLGTSMVIREFARLSDQAKTLNAQLLIVEGSMRKVREAHSALLDMSIRTGTALDANVELYGKVKRALEDQYGASGKYLAVTETVSKALVLAGADAGTAAGAIRQLGQAFGSGAFRGDEFNSVAEAAPPIMRALATSLGVSTGKLREMAAEGKLTSDILYKALSEPEFTAEIHRDFENLPPTFSRAMQNIKTAATVVFGQFDRGGQFSDYILNFAKFGAEDIKSLGKTARDAGGDIRAAFTALDDIFTPIVTAWIEDIDEFARGFNTSFGLTESAVKSLSEEILGLMELLDKLADLPERAAWGVGQFLADIGDPFARGISLGQYSSSWAFNERRQQRFSELDDARAENGFAQRYRLNATVNRLPGFEEVDVGGLGQALGLRKEIAAAAGETANADGKSAKELEKAAKEASNRLKAANDNLESASRELELMRAVWDGDVERTRLRHELEDIDSVRDGLSKAELAILGPILDKTKAITEELYKQARFAEIAADAKNRLDPGALHDPDKDLADLKRGFQEAGRAGGRALRDESLLAAEAFGQALGGHVGGVIRQLAGVLQGMKSGDFTGVGGPIGGILTLLGGSGGYKMIGGGAALPGGGTMSRLPDLTAGGMFRKGMKDVFGDALDPLKRAGKEIASAFGANGAFTETLGRAFGGAGVGTATGGVMKALGIKSSTTGAQVGGAIGGMIPIPGGAIIGSVAGGLLGGVLKGILNPARTARANITGIDDALGLGGKDRKNYGMASDLGGAVQEGLRGIADVLGAEIGKFNVTIGVRDKDYRVNTSGTSLKTGKGAMNFGDDAEAAIAYAVRDAIRDGALKGISEFSQRALKSALELEQAVDIAAKYEQILKSLNSSNAIEAAAKDFASGFDSLVTQMKKVGATAAELANVETYYARERERALKDLLDPLLDYRKSLSGEGSGVTALDRFKTSRLEYEQAKSDFSLGKIDQGAFTAAGQELFSLARDIFGTATDEFQNIRKMLLADTASAIDTATDAFNSGAPERLLAAQEAANTIAAQQYQQQVITNQQLAAIQQALAGLYGGGVAGGYYANGVWIAA